MNPVVLMVPPSPGNNKSKKQKQQSLLTARNNNSSKLAVTSTGSFGIEVSGGMTPRYNSSATAITPRFNPAALTPRTQNPVPLTPRQQLNSSQVLSSNGSTGLLLDMNIIHTTSSSIPAISGSTSNTIVPSSSNNLMKAMLPNFPGMRKGGNTHLHTLLGSSGALNLQGG